MSHGYTRRVVLFDSESINSTTFTSSDVFVGDFDRVVVSVETAAGAASLLTLQGSNDDGFNTSITTRSVLTGIAVSGIYPVEPGFRWLRAQRASVDSQNQAYLQLGGS